MVRAKEPINLQLAKGNRQKLTKQQIEQRRKEEIKAPADQIAAPNYLDKEAVIKFNYYAEQLQRINIISNLDVGELARLAALETQFERIAVQLPQLEINSAEYKDLLIKSEKLFKACRSSAAALGLDIISRNRIVAPESKEKKENKFAKFM